MSDRRGYYVQKETSRYPRGRGAPACCPTLVTTWDHKKKNVGLGEKHEESLPIKVLLVVVIVVLANNQRVVFF